MGGSRWGLQIRALTRSDAPGLSGLMAAAGRTVASAALAARIDALPSAGVALVAVEWGPPGGVVAVHWTRTLTADVPVARVTFLLVAPDDRRRGLGRALLKAAAQAARAAGCGEFHLEVADGDDGSLGAFCRATGFDRAGEGYVRPLRKGAGA